MLGKKKHEPHFLLAAFSSARCFCGLEIKQKTTNEKVGRESTQGSKFKVWEGKSEVKMQKAKKE